MSVSLKAIKESQKNWIGKSEGALIKFDDIEVFTTRPDTLFGATFIAISGKEDKFTGKYVTNPATKEKIPVWEAEYILSDYGTGAIMGVPAHDERDYEFAKKHDLPIKEVILPKFIDEENPHVSGKEVVFRNAVIAVVRNPKKKEVLCLKWKKLPWTTFVMGGIEDGEDAITAAKREILEETGYSNVKFIKDLGKTHAEFFAAHKDVNRIAHTKWVLFELEDETRVDVSAEEDESYEVVWVSEDKLNPKDMKHVETDVMLQKIGGESRVYTGEGVLVNSQDFDFLSTQEAKEKIAKKFGQKVTKYKLRDWVVSRQRYWGVPIPIIHCDKCGAVAVSDSDLPVVLPEVDDYLPRDDGKSPLSKVNSWVETSCPKCGGSALRETDTLDTFVDSSWYFLRYADPKNEQEFASKEKLKEWMPVDFYSGGAEHTTMHLLYSRFLHKVLFDMGLVYQNEPYVRRMNRGLIMGPDGQKMSKSKGNVIDPDKEVERLGADTVRAYLSFIGPYNEVGAYPWNPDGAVGVRRFLERVWRLRGKVSEKTTSEVVMAPVIKRVTDNIINMKMNTSVSALMVATRLFDDLDNFTKESYETLLKLLAPFAPHMTEELWQLLGHKDSIHKESWPEFDPTKLQADEVTIVVQVNGRVRGTFVAPINIDEIEVTNIVEKLPEIQKWLVGKNVSGYHFVRGKLINIVTT